VVSLDRFPYPFPWENEWQCEDCGKRVPYGVRVCETCKQVHEFDAHEDEYKMGIRECAYSWLNKEGDI
jgi:hypothetical protein